MRSSLRISTICVATMIELSPPATADETDAETNKHYGYNYNAVCNMSEKYIAILSKTIDLSADKIVYTINIDRDVFTTYEHKSKNSRIKYIYNVNYIDITYLEADYKFITNDDLYILNLYKTLGTNNKKTLESGILCENYEVKFEFSGNKSVKIFVNKFSVD